MSDTQNSPASHYHTFANNARNQIQRERKQDHWNKSRKFTKKHFLEQLVAHFRNRIKYLIRFPSKDQKSSNANSLKKKLLLLYHYTKLLVNSGVLETKRKKKQSTKSRNVYNIQINFRLSVNHVNCSPINRWNECISALVSVNCVLRIEIERDYWFISFRGIDRNEVRGKVYTNKCNIKFGKFGINRIQLRYNSIRF